MSQIVLDLAASPSFPYEVMLGDKAEDILVPQAQYSLLSDILEGQDVVISARLDKYVTGGASVVMYYHCIKRIKICAKISNAYMP